MLTLAIIDAQSLFSDVLLPLAAATVLGGAIGLEREIHGRPAGLRTHIIVCLATTMAMLVSMELFHRFTIQGPNSPLRVDPSRIAAGIFTGIGFLGAGAIMKLKSSNRGLTTAACIWFAAGLGVVIGTGEYALAIVGTLFALGVLMLLVRVERRIRPETYREITVVAARSDGLIEQVEQTVADLGMVIQSHEFEEEVEKGLIRAVFNVRFRRAHLGEELLRSLRAIPGVRTIGWRTTPT